MTIRILVADDHEIMRQGIVHVLGSLNGVEILQAQNGAEAVQIAANEKPDLIILDVSMPVLDGFSAAREIKNASPQTPIIILTLQKTEVFSQVAERIGIDAYLTKTEDGPSLLRTVDRLLGESKKAAGAGTTH
jgi:DNA-binding NarL/FixJ family response regulator